MNIAMDATNRVHILWHGFKDKNKPAGAYSLAEVDRVLIALRDDLKALQNLYRQPVTCAFDPPGKTFRHELYADYKAGRPEKERGLEQALADAPAVVQISGCVVAQANGFEADDLLASIAYESVAAGVKCVLISKDKDVRQCLVVDWVSILRDFRRHGQQIDKNEVTYLTAASFQAEFGFPPERWVDYQSLCGDKTDNIHGWDGVGDVAARKWLKDKSLADILNNPWCVPMNKAQDRTLSEFRKRYFVVRELVKLRTDALQQATIVKAAA